MYRILIATLILFGFSSKAVLAQEIRAVNTATSFLTLSITEVMTFAFNDYDKLKQANKNLFTDEGYTSFYDAMDKSRIPDMVKANKQILTTAPRGAPVLLTRQDIAEQEGLWVFELPLVLTYLSGNKTRTDYVNAKVTLKKVADQRNTFGLGIEQFIASPVSHSSCLAEDDEQLSKIYDLKLENKRLKERVENLEKNSGL